MDTLSSTTRSCDGCSACCKVMHVLELNKPANQWCEHCAVWKGCLIYNERPTSCREFACLYLQDEQMPEELRPDRSKVVLSINRDETALVAYVDPRQEEAYKRGPMGRFLERVSTQLPVIVVCGDKRKAMTVLKEPVIFTEQEPDGSERIYVPKDGNA